MAQQHETTDAQREKFNTDTAILEFKMTEAKRFSLEIAEHRLMTVLRAPVNMERYVEATKEIAQEYETKRADAVRHGMLPE